MTLSFTYNTIEYKFEHTTPYFLREAQGLNAEIDYQDSKVPRTDFSAFVSGYTPTKVRQFAVTIVGSTVSDLREKYRIISNLVGHEFTFTIEDDYVNADQSVTVFATYTFTGRISAISPEDFISSRADFSIQITSENPYLYLTPALDESVDIGVRGFAFPFALPFGFGGTLNQIEIDNTGGADIYPVFEIHGILNGVTITTDNPNVTNINFDYSGTIGAGSTLEINPLPTNAVKAYLDGVNALALTNSNFDCLIAPAGRVTTYSFYSDSVGAGASADITYSLSYKSIR